MKLMYSTFVMGIMLSLHGSGQDIDDRAVKFYQALRFFRIISQIPSEVASNILPKIRNPHLDIYELCDIWDGIPEAAHTPITIPIDDTNTVQIDALMVENLRESLAPLYARESLRLYRRFNDTLQKKFPNSREIDCIIQYMRPLQPAEYQELKQSGINKAHLYAYNIPGSRQYWQKLVWYENECSRGPGVWDTNYRAKRCTQLTNWNNAIKQSDTQGRARAFRAWKEDKCHRQMHLEKTSSEEFKMLDEKDLSTWEFLFDLADTVEQTVKRLTPIHADLVKIAPHIKLVRVYGANGDDRLCTLLERYTWHRTLKLELFHPDGDWKTARLQTFLKNNPGITTRLYVSTASWDLIREDFIY